MSISTQPTAGNGPPVILSGSASGEPKAEPGPRPRVAYRPNFTDFIPKELRDRPQWVVWRYALVKNKKTGESKWTKVPYKAKCPRDKAATNNPKTWGPFIDAARAYHAARDLEGVGRIDGIGYVFSKDDPYVGVDLDNCLEGKVEAGGKTTWAIREWAVSYVQRLPTDSEISPSGNGIKFIGRGKLPGGGHRKSGLGPDGTGAVEMYDQLRFFTITGNIVTGQPTTIEDVSEAILEIHDEIWPPKPVKPKAAPRPPAPALESDDDLLRRAFGAKNGADVEALFRGDTSRNHHDDSSADLALCNALAFWFGGDEAAMDRVFRRSGLYRDKWDERRGATTYGQMTIAKSIEGRTDFYEPSKPLQWGGKPASNGEASNGRPTEDQHQAGDQRSARVVIEVNVDQHRVLAETLAVLTGDPGLYQRGNVLVRIAHEEDDTAVLAGGVKLEKAKGIARVILVGEAGLSCRLTAVADFFSWAKDKSGEEFAKPIHPPHWLVAATAEHGSYPGVRKLKGIAEVPFPRPDGTLVTAPGYDPGTGFFYAPSVNVGVIPDRPTKADAEAAAKVLMGPFRQFPFATDGDRAVCLAGVLTAVGMPAINGSVPGIAVNGNKAGTGKGKLIDSISTISHGRPVPTTTYPEDKAEAEKVKVALALAATQMVHFDNIEEGRTYGGGVVDSMLTSPGVGGRILGQSKNVDGLELRCCWFLSGNNVSPVKDAHRRWLVCNLVTDLEHPEERRDLDIPDLLEHVREHRAELVRAALLILRAHAVAGWPRGDWAPLGSFEQWDRVVRGAVWFSTGWDCNTTRRKAAEESPDRLNKLALLEAWKALPGGSLEGWGLTAEEAHRMAFGAGSSTPPTHPSLVDVFLRFSRDGKTSPRTTGNIIRGMRGQNIGGFAFKSDRDKRRSLLWYVAQVSPNTPYTQKPCESGESSESCSKPPRVNAEHEYDVNLYTPIPQASECAGTETHQTHQTHTDTHQCGCLRLDCPDCQRDGEPRPSGGALRYLTAFLAQGSALRDRVVGMAASEFDLTESDIEAAARALEVERFDEYGAEAWRIS